MRRPRPLPVIFVLCLGPMIPATGQAETIVGESIGWVVADSDLVVRGTVTDVRLDKQGQTVSDAVTVDVAETLKGKAATSTSP